MAVAVTDYAGHEIAGAILYNVDGSVLIGQKASAASLSVVPASDIPDPTYIGDIKFGEALPAGSAIVGKVGIDQTTPGTTNGVQVNAALPAGDNNIGNIDVASIAAGNNNIGDVDVASIAGGTNVIGKVRMVTANGDEATHDTADAVKVCNPDGTNIGGTGGTAMTDDAAFTPGSSSITPMGAMADETSPDSVDEGDIGTPRMTLNRVLRVAPTLFAGNGNAPAAGYLDTPQSLFGDALLTSAVRTATTNSSTMYNHNHRGAIFQLNIDSAAGGGETLTMKVQVKIGNGAFITIFQSAALTGANRYNYVVCPDWGAAANEITAVGNYSLPRTWQIEMTHSAGGNWTYDLQFSYVD